jgi:hypothetical protein
MRIRLALAGTAALLAGGAALASSASASANPPPAPGGVYVTVTHDNGGVQFHSGMPGQPLWSVTADNGGICFGFSYEMGQCVGVAPAG